MWCARTSNRKPLKAARLRLLQAGVRVSFIYFVAISFSSTKKQSALASPIQQESGGELLPQKLGAQRPAPTPQPCSLPVLGPHQASGSPVGARCGEEGSCWLGPRCCSRAGRRASKLEPGSLPGLLAAAFDKASLCVGWGPGRLEPAHIWRPAEAQAAGGRQRRHPEPHARPWVNTPAPTQRLTFRPQGCLSSRTRAHATANIPPGHRAEQAAHPTAG